MEKKLSIRHEFYESTIGCGPCEAWQGPIDVAEVKISLAGGKSGYALYRKEAVIPAEVSYSINENSFFAKGYNSQKSLESYSRLEDAKSSEFYPVFRQLLDTVNAAAKARKNGKLSPDSKVGKSSMSEEKKSIVVKASKILAYAKKHGAEINVEVTDDDDLKPYLTSVSIDVDEETHKCTLSGSYAYREDSPTHGINYGNCHFSILGVEFTTDFEFKQDFSTSGNDIDFGDMDEDEFWDDLQELINLPSYDVDDYPFEEGDVTDEELIEAMDSDYSVFALDDDGEVCAFDDEGEIPSEGYTVIDQDEAYEQLASDRPGLEFEQWG